MLKKLTFHIIFRQKALSLPHKRPNFNNQIMKQSIWIILMTTILIATGCSKSEDSIFDVGSDHFVWDSDVRLQTVQIKCDGKWVAESNVWWCSPVRKSGTGDAELPIWVSPNLTRTERQGKITVCSDGRTHIINVSQPIFTGSLDNYDYHLPVVFHILYKDSTDEQQYVRQGHMGKILEQVNMRYKQNGMNIVFEPARYNDYGEELEEPGVVRHKVSFDDYDPSEFLNNKNTDNRQYAKYGQNLKKYINVYVFRFKQNNDGSNTMGVSDMPVMPTAHPLDSLHTTDDAGTYTHLSVPWGCFINNEFIYEWQEANSYNPYDIVNTIAHELGHYIGLLHTFSMNECEEDDACDDTPVCDYMNYVAYMSEYIKQQTAQGVNTFKLSDLARRHDCKTLEDYVAHNIMDYLYSYNDEFSAQQKRRTRQVLLYSPLVPGPKLVAYDTRASATRSLTPQPSLTHHILPCPSLPMNRHNILRRK